MTPTHTNTLVATVCAALLLAGMGTAQPADGDAVLRLRHAGTVTAVAFSPDGKSLAAGDMNEGVRLWRVEGGKELWHARAVTAHAVAFAPDGKTLAAAGWEGAARFLDPASGKVLREFDVEVEKDVYTLAFSADGKRLAVGGRGGGVSVYDSVAGKASAPLAARGRVSSVAFSPDGRLLAGATTGDKVTVWDTVTGEEARPFRGKELQGYCVAFSPDGRTLATGTSTGAVCLREVATGEVVHQLKGDRVHALAFSHDGLMLAVGGSQPAVKVWGAMTGEELGELKGAEGAVFSVCFSPDGRRLAAGSADKTATVWELRRRIKAATPSAVELAARDMERLWADLAGDDAAKAYRAVWALGGSARQSVPFVAERLRSAVAVDEKKVGQWVKDLDSARFATRQQAEAELRKLGRPAELALYQALKGAPSLEARRRLEDLLRAMEGEAPTGEWRRLLRAVAVLEHVGTAEAKRALEDLTRGAPEAGLSREAHSALERLRGNDGR